jgi:hypothetical protein
LVFDGGDRRLQELVRLAAIASGQRRLHRGRCPPTTATDFRSARGNVVDKGAHRRRLGEPVRVQPDQLLE